jgi:hypothetical protein
LFKYSKIIAVKTATFLTQTRWHSLKPNPETYEKHFNFSITNNIFVL